MNLNYGVLLNGVAEFLCGVPAAYKCRNIGYSSSRSSRASLAAVVLAKEAVQTLNLGFFDFLN